MKFNEALVLIVDLAAISVIIGAVNEFISNITTAIINICTRGLTLEILGKYVGKGIVQLIVVVFSIFIAGIFLKNIKDWLWEEEE